MFICKLQVAEIIVCRNPLSVRIHIDGVVESLKLEAVTDHQHTQHEVPIFQVFKRCIEATKFQEYVSSHHKTYVDIILVLNLSQGDHPVTLARHIADDFEIVNLVKSTRRDEHIRALICKEKHVRKSAWEINIVVVQKCYEFASCSADAKIAAIRRTAPWYLIFKIT